MAPKLREKEEALAQAARMMSMRLFEHKTVAEIAKEYGMERATESRRLKLARENGVPEEARTIFIREMLPAAMAVVLDTLKSTDEKLRMSAAKMVIEGLDAMKPPEDEQAARKAGAGDNDEYEVWRERIKITRKSISGSERAATGAIIDATPVQTADSACDVSPDRAEPPAVSLREGPADGS